jgi:small GTP-binding protein
VLRGGNRPKNLRELGINTLKNLPANITMVRGFMKAVNWKQAQDEVEQNLRSNVAIVGQPNSGKSTLFNQIIGKQVSAVSPEAGTTKTLVRRDFGPFTLVDTPGHLPDVTESGMADASVIVFLIDSTKGFQTEDRNLYENMKKLNKPIIIAVNKVDALKGGESGKQLANEIAVLLGVVGVIPISAKTGRNIADELLPEIIDASPDAALVIGRELPRYRHEAAQRLIRNATLVSLAAGLEPIPLVDIPILLGTQIRLVLRLAALYGESMNSEETRKYARELIITMAGGLGMRYIAEEAAKAVPFGGDLVAGAIAGAATWAIGQVALEYYEGGKKLSPSRMRDLYQNFYRLFRKQKTNEEWRQYALEGKETPLGLEKPGDRMKTPEGTA